MLGTTNRSMAGSAGRLRLRAREVAIGKTHPRAAEAAVIGLLDVEARLERHALERRANGLTSDPERSRRQRYRACPSRAAELDGADQRAVTIDAAGAARAIETIKREKLAGCDAEPADRPLLVEPLEQITDRRVQLGEAVEPTVT